MEKLTIIQRLSGDEFTGEVVHGNCIRCKADIHGEPHLKFGSIKVHSTTVVKWAYFCYDCGSEIQALVKSRPAVNKVVKKPTTNNRSPQRAKPRSGRVR